VDACVINTNISSKEPISQHKTFLWQLPSTIIFGHWELYSPAHPSGKGRNMKPETFLSANKSLTLQSERVKMHCDKEEWQGLCPQIMQFHSYPFILESYD